MKKIFYLLVIMLMFVPVSIQAASIYYVSLLGNDSNPGTQAQPWKTIQKCLNQVQPGDTCEVFGGTYNESLVLKTSGTQSARITLKNHNQEIVTINSGGSQTLVTGGRIHNYTIDGLRFVANYNSPGQGDYTIHLGLNVWDGYNNRDGGNNSFILRNCYVEGAIKFYGHDNLVENCELNGKQNWANGLVDQWGSSYDNIYRNNNIHDYKIRGIWTMQYTDNIIIEANTVYDNGEMGIDCDGAANPVTRCFVRKNIIYDITGEGVGILLENAFNSVVDANRIYNVINGIHTMNYGPGISAIEYRTTDINTVFANNLVYNTRRAGILCMASPGGKALHNTIYKTSQDTSVGYLGGIAFLDHEGFYCKNWEIKNNIIAQSRVAPLWFKVSPIGFTDFIIDNNLYDLSPSEAKIKWAIVSGSSTNYYSYTLEQMQNLRQLELNSILGDPLFINVLNYDFNIQTNSPAINHGINVGISNDISGVTRPQGIGFDIGAHEFIEDESPTNTPFPSATWTPASTKTSTPTPSFTPSPTKTYTPTPTFTLTPTSTSTPVPEFIIVEYQIDLCRVLRVTWSDGSVMYLSPNCSGWR